MKLWKMLIASILLKKKIRHSTTELKMNGNSG